MTPVLVIVGASIYHHLGPAPRRWRATGSPCPFPLISPLSYRLVSSAQCVLAVSEPVVKSALRVLELFELFDAQRRPLRVAEIVAGLDAPQSSVSMLLKTLVARGYMDFDSETREYCPSVRIAFLGAWAVGNPRQRELIIEAMRRLSNDTDETILLGRRMGLFLQYLSVIESSHRIRLTLSAGTLRPLHRTSIGILLLSQLPDDEVSRMLRRFNAEHSHQFDAADITATMRSIAFARDRGYFESESLATQGSGVIATLLPTPVRGQSLGLGVGGPISRLHARRQFLTTTLLRIAGEL